MFIAFFYFNAPQLEILAFARSVLEIHFRNADEPSKIYLHLLQIRKELDDIKSKNEQIKAEVRGS